MACTPLTCDGASEDDGNVHPMIRLIWGALSYEAHVVAGSFDHQLVGARVGHNLVQNLEEEQQRFRSAAGESMQQSCNAPCYCSACTLASQDGGLPGRSLPYSAVGQCLTALYAAEPAGSLHFDKIMTDRDVQRLLTKLQALPLRCDAGTHTSPATVCPGGSDRLCHMPLTIVKQN